MVIVVVVVAAAAVTFAVFNVVASATVFAIIGNDINCKICKLV
jgi:hypothetical protein